jgi:hypothetical protein
MLCRRQVLVMLLSIAAARARGGSPPLERARIQIPLINLIGVTFSETHESSLERSHVQMCCGELSRNYAHSPLNTNILQ